MAEQTTRAHPESVSGRRRPARWARLARAREHSVLVVIVLLMCLYFYVTEPLFLSGTNLQHIASQSSVLALMAAGQLFVILGGGIDISVGAQVSLLSIIAVKLSLVAPLGIALGLTILAGVGIGLVNGLLVTYCRLSPIIATIATWQVILGAMLVWTDGESFRNFASNYTTVGTANVWFFPLAGLIALSIFLLAAFMLRRTRFGRYTYAVGGNPEASRLSGIKVNRVLIGTYVTCSVFTALAAIVLSSRVGSGLADLGNGLEITTIAAVFLGGIAWGGGSGTALGALLGVLIIALLGNGFDLSSVSTDVQTIVTGVLMALAVGIAELRKRARHG